MAALPQTGDLTGAWKSLERAEWQAAHDAFAAHLEANPEAPAALDGLGRALWWLGDTQAGVERRREAYALYGRQGDTRAAANLAGYLAAESTVE